MARHAIIKIGPEPLEQGIHGNVVRHRRPTEAVIPSLFVRRADLETGRFKEE